jgi:hypothetical protein
MSKESEKDNRSLKNNNNKFKLKSVAKKEKNSERNRLKQNLRDFIENGFDNDNFEDEIERQ